MREGLRRLFHRQGPSIATAKNYLDLEFHWADTIRLLGELAGQPLQPEEFKIICVDIEYLGNGDVVGDGPRVLHIARENADHFIPVVRRTE